MTACTSSQNAKTVGYDALGNIRSKSDVGSLYTYPAAGSAQPHAPSSITGTVNGVVNPSYSYDANGNMTSGAGRTVAYTSFNMAASITQGTTTVTLSYDDAHARIKMVGPSGTTYYLNDPASGTMEEKLVSGSTTTWHDYIQADGHIVAEKFAGGTNAVRYFVGDHLGSTAILTDETGAVVERDAYDPWGKRRHLDGSDDTACALTSQTTRGFTGHEHIDSECLINANARLYDPTIGRFMSADDEVPDPNNGQAYNRFSYVNNGPLSATDPTGHDPHPTPTDPNNATGLADAFESTETVIVTGIRCSEDPKCAVVLQRAQLELWYYQFNMGSMQQPPPMVLPPVSAGQTKPGQNGQKNSVPNNVDTKKWPSCSLLKLRDYSNTITWVGAGVAGVGAFGEVIGGGETATVAGAPAGVPTMAGSTVLAVGGTAVAGVGGALYTYSSLGIAVQTGSFHNFWSNYAGGKAWDAFTSTVEAISSGKTRSLSPLLSAFGNQATAKDESGQCTRP